jgi:uncharacterized protein involved in high-affinity Fe2+ transport
MRSDSNSGKRGIRASADSTDFLLEFDTANEEFQRGFECGEIWACLTDNVLAVKSIITAKNAEMVMRMAEATGYSYEGRYLTEEEISQLKVGPGEWMVVVMRSNDDSEEQ